MQATVVRCQHNCLYRLALINGHNVGHLLATHYEYLHYCYYKRENTFSVIAPDLYLLLTFQDAEQCMKVMAKHMRGNICRLII